MRKLAIVEPQLFLREASARLFDGLSKVLDGRTEFVSGILGGTCPWLETPVPLVVAVPQGAALCAVVFVENLTTFERLRMCRGRYPGTAFIYSAGWRGAATRAGTGLGRSCYFDDAPTTDDAHSLQAALDGFPSDLTLHFFGDLDFSGMGILKTMRQTYPSLLAWQPGYRALLCELESGRSHVPSSADKDRQANPGATGCDFADGHLLPRLIETGRFVDQEVWVGE